MLRFESTACWESSLGEAHGGDNDASFWLTTTRCCATSLAEQLAAGGAYVPVEAGNVAEGKVKAQEGLYEFMVLDVGLPDGDGRDLCRELREAGITCPIIMLTAADSDADTIEGLKAGANDYISKPFRFAVLMARVRCASAQPRDRARKRSIASGRTRSGRARRCCWKAPSASA